MDIIVNTMLLAQSTPTDQQQVGISFLTISYVVLMIKP